MLNFILTNFKKHISNVNLKKIEILEINNKTIKKLINLILITFDTINLIICFKKFRI